MVKHSQAVRRQFADKLSVFDHFAGMALKRVNFFRIIVFLYFLNF